MAKQSTLKSVRHKWRQGFGVIKHSPITSRRLHALAHDYAKAADGLAFWDLLSAADRLTSAAMWLTVHDTYAKNVYLDGQPMAFGDFKTKPEGHTGSSLNIIPAYVGYLVANALTGHTRAWVAEQGHAVSGIDGVNVLVGNTTPAHERYSVSNEGLSRFVQDFYSYRVTSGAEPESPRGSHINAHTAGSLLEGGYLGFAGLQYVHMPLKGERLVTFLSDGAFEEQRGPDWAPRWWRAEDCGLVTPIMIYNSRRIDQRTTLSQQGGTRWFRKHLELNDFEPIVFDGSDPAAYAWAIIEMEKRLKANGKKNRFKLPYGIAVVPKGYGFYAFGTNDAHNLPLGATIDTKTIQLFNKHAGKLWVSPPELHDALQRFNQHKKRPRERDHVLACRDVALKKLVDAKYKHTGETAAPIQAVDDYFVEICLANRHLRPRIGNPDEMSSKSLLRNPFRRLTDAT